LDIVGTRKKEESLCNHNPKWLYPTIAKEKRNR